MAEEKEAQLTLRIKALGQKSLSLVKRGLSGVGEAARKGAMALAAIAAASIKAFADYEKGVINVGKTTGMAGSELRNLGRDIREMSKRLPTSTNELLEIAGAAGQLGVKGAGNIKNFTEVMAKLALSSDVAGEEGAKAITRILTLTGEGVPAINQFASALVDLGNNAAASEAEILGVATRVGGAVGAFKASGAGVLGISTALKSMGKQAEEAGSTVGRVFLSIDQSIKNGGKEFKNLQRITGMTGDQLKKTFKEDSTQVFQAFINGMRRIQDSGGNVTRELGKFDLQGVRVQSTIATLINKNHLLNENMERSAKAWNDNTALQKEADEAMTSLSSGLATTKNIVFAFAQEVGENLAPIISFFIEQVGESQTKTSGWADAVKGLSVTFIWLTKAGIGIKNTFEALVGTISNGFFNSLLAIGQLIKGDFSGALEIMRENLKENADIIVQEMDDIHTSLAEIDAKYAAKQQQKDIDRKVKKEERAKQHELKLIKVKKEGQKKQEKDQKEADKKAKSMQELREQASIESFQDFFSTVNQLSSSGNKALQAIGKAAALTRIAIQTPEAVASAFKFGTAIGGPPLGFTMGGVAAAAMAAQAARVAGVQLADGGIVKATAGGTPAILGEGKYDEAVIPLGGEGAAALSPTININVGAFLGDEQQATEFAVMIDEKLMELRQNNVSVAFDTDIG